MSPLRARLPVALLLAAACGGESTIVEVDVASVTVGPASPTVEVGLTVQLTATALDASGNQVTGQPVTWQSNDPSIATVTDAGVATGVSAGSVPITATIDGVMGSQTLIVEATECTSRTDVVLLPGQYASFPGDECLLLPAGATGDVYRVAVVRPTLVASATNPPNVTLSLTPVAVAAAAAEGADPTSDAAAAPEPQLALARDELPRIRSPYLAENLRRREATRRFHDELRRLERDLGLSGADLLPNLARAGGPLPTGHEPPATDSLFLDPNTSCGPGEAQPVQLIGFDDQLAVYQETAERDTAAISTAAADELIGYYDLYVKDMIEDYWGRLPDIDANGRVIIVTSPDLGENVAAAVTSRDFYQQGPECLSSNEGEYMYFSGEVIRALDDENHFALGVVAHEAKHIISLYNGIERGDPGPASFHDLWIEEGTAEISQVMSARIAWAAIGGPAPNEPVTGQALIQTYQDHGEQIPPEMSAVIDELAGITYALSSHPNSLLTDPDGAPDEHSFYLTSWHWHRFMGDAFGNASDAPFADSTFFRTLTDPSTPAGGASGQIQITGRSFEQLFEDFVVAVSFHGSAFSPTYEIDTWDFLSATAIFSTPDPTGDYPWPVTANETNQWDPFTAASHSGAIGPAGVRFHDFRSSGTAGAQIQVTNSAQTCDQDTSARCDRIIVSRLN